MVVRHAASNRMHMPHVGLYVVSYAQERGRDWRISGLATNSNPRECGIRLPTSQSQPAWLNAARDRKQISHIDWLRQQRADPTFTVAANEKSRAKDRVVQELEGPVSGWITQVPAKREEGPMNPPEHFRNYAAECKAMAKSTRSRESKAAWDCVAARWVRCAKLIGSHWSANRSAKADSGPQPLQESPRRRKGRLSHPSRTEPARVGTSGFG
jgi:hypothetical protein